MKKVVVAIDGSETSRAVVDYALYYANREIDVKIVFFHVIEPYKSLWRSVAMKPYEDLMAAVEVSFKRFVEEEMDKIPVDREKMSLVAPGGSLRGNRPFRRGGRGRYHHDRPPEHVYRDGAVPGGQCRREGRSPRAV